MTKSLIGAAELLAPLGCPHTQASAVRIAIARFGALPLNWTRMNNDRELIHIAMQWHTAHARRMAIGAEKRRLDKEIKAEGFDVVFSLARTQQGNAARQLTDLKRRELATLRLLAKACAKQRGHLDVADVIELDTEAKLLTCAA